jgi:hypothetical protein
MKFVATPCRPDASGWKCDVHELLPLYPSGMCKDGINQRPGSEDPYASLLNRYDTASTKLREAEIEILRLRAEIDGLRTAVLRLDDRCKALSEKNGWRFWRPD